MVNSEPMRDTGRVPSARRSQNPEVTPATVCFGTGRRAGVDCWFTYLKNWTLLLDVQIIAENRVHHRARSKRVSGLTYPSKVVGYIACAYQRHWIVLPTIAEN